ncbi:hypothetical protein [Chitinibacter sp. GC72]|uniref:hypothetical protein n=1 Tax=Chitinibacter sp. GC72 TaxID=1526917 RepID=UPI0018E0230A|nr:hypothetical protein [Chitinibacter sp. GC72]
MKIPSDLKILQAIFDSYSDQFPAHDGDPTIRSAKMYVPIDCKLIAKKLSTDPDIVFGRLYYHLEKKYGYTYDDGIKVHFFALKVGQDTKCINFALLTSVLAGLQEGKKKFWIVNSLAIISIVISFFAFAISLYPLVFKNSGEKKSSEVNSSQVSALKIENTPPSKTVASTVIPNNK